MTTPRNLSSRYELGEILGFGGMSEVHKARDLRLGREVAIKILRADLARDPEFYLRFRREAQNAAALNHPNIVAVYDTGEAETETGPLPYIVMEYVDGETLREVVRTQGPIEPGRATAIIADVCAALDFSHRHGIIHRDVKPGNIMINREGAVKVMDFGIARAITDAASPMTQTAAVIGTAQYLSPEQARGEQVDARSDVYSLGCVLFEVLTGRAPFTGDSPVAIAYQHVREDPQRPSSLNPAISADLDAIVLKSMAKNPDNRYQSAAEMRADLQRVAAGRRPDAPAVLTDADRTELITTSGAGATGAWQSAEPQAYSEAREAPAAVAVQSAEQGPRRNPVKIALITLAALVVLGVVGAFGYTYAFGSRSGIAVPNVTNQAADQAESTLSNAGFKVTRQQRADPSIIEGNVIATRPAAGSRAKSGSTVTMDVSSGPDQVPAPQLTGMTLEEAQRALSGAGLKLDPGVPDRGTSSPEDKDKVIRQDPAAGAGVKPGATVRITLGSGPEQVRVPDVGGQRESVARANIEGAGFTVEIVPVDSAQPAGIVVRTSPAGGSNGDRGGTVQLMVSNGANFTMPDLTFRSISDALAVLRSAGWTGEASQIEQTGRPTLDPTEVGKVLEQAQAPGTEVGKTAKITVTVGQLGIPR